jgi:hypothetical protein
LITAPRLVRTFKPFVVGSRDWWDLEENQSYNSGSFFRDQRDTCESLDSNNEAFYSGAVNAGCDLMTFTDALIDINSWIPSYDPEEEVWTHHVCDY